MDGRHGIGCGPQVNIQFKNTTVYVLGAHLLDPSVDFVSALRLRNTILNTGCLENIVFALG